MAQTRQTGVWIAVAALAVAALAIVAIIAFWLGQRSTCLPPPPPVTADVPLPADLRFIDHFETIDLDRWTVIERDDHPEHFESDFRQSQVFVSPEGLAIEMIRPPEGDRLWTGQIQSSERYRYGYYETRLRVPRGEGVFIGAFTYAGPWDGVEPPQEIDIEILGTRPRIMEASYHLGGGAVGERVRLGFDASQAFHSYAFEWTPERLRWFVDGAVVHEVTDPRIAQMDAPQRILLGLGGTRGLAAWAGYIDLDGGPWRMTISCAASAETYPGRMLCPPEVRHAGLSRQ